MCILNLLTECDILYALAYGSSVEQFLVCLSLIGIVKTNITIRVESSLVEKEFWCRQAVPVETNGIIHGTRPFWLFLNDSFIILNAVLKERQLRDFTQRGCASTSTKMSSSDSYSKQQLT
jgi:hypothetical protein